MAVLTLILKTSIVDVCLTIWWNPAENIEATGGSMIRERYAVWNNKGGVGKSTLTFHLAASYADKHPDERVLVVDMCPQANCTMMLLGSGIKGEGRLVQLETQIPA